MLLQASHELAWPDEVESGCLVNKTPKAQKAGNYLFLVVLGLAPLLSPRIKQMVISWLVRNQINWFALYNDSELQREDELQLINSRKNILYPLTAKLIILINVSLLKKLGIPCFLRRDG